jgi:hypothetical protein
MRAIQKAQEKANETFHNYTLRSFDERLQDVQAKRNLCNGEQPHNRK